MALVPIDTAFEIDDGEAESHDEPSNRLTKISRLPNESVSTQAASACRPSDDCVMTGKSPVTRYDELPTFVEMRWGETPQALL